MFKLPLPPQLQDFITILLGILVEALPFVILGSVVAAIINAVIKEKWILKVLPKNRFLSHMLVPFLGVIFPVCECGNVPVAKRLFFKGFKSSQVLTFLLAAPAFNPIVFLATYTAFKSSIDIVILRFVFTYIVAVIVGILISYKKDDREFLQPDFVEDIECYIDEKPSIKKFFENILDDFGTMLMGLFIGATIASALQNFAPVDVLRTLGQNPILSIITMMLIAFIISICSNVDAFVALSYASKFTSGSLVAFLVFGPMIDIKSLSMFSTIYKKKFLLIITSIVTLLIFLLCLILNFYYY